MHGLDIARGLPILWKVNFIVAAIGLLREEKQKEELRKMLKSNLKESMIIVLNVVSIFLTLFAISTNLVFASGGSIAMANYYPDDGGTYGFIDHFLEQTTAVNTNTTVSVSIDGGPLIPMTYQGIRNEMVSGDTVAHDWYTWQIAIPAIMAPGGHSFQFFSHYYVWQEVDQYWTEFNAYSNVHSFTIACPLPTPSQSPPPTTINPVCIFTAIAFSSVVAFLVLVTFVPRNRSQRHSAHACSEIGQKWFLFFLLWDLRAVLGFAVLPNLLAVSAFLKPAKVLEAAEREGYNLHRRV